MTSIQTVLPLSAPSMSFPDPEVLASNAVQTLRAALLTNAVAVAWSSGKDSTACLILTLLALERLNDEGLAPAAPLYVVHGDTEVENPAITALASSLIADLETWAAARGHDVRVRIATPLLQKSWAVSILGGGALPTYANSRMRQCSHNMKIDPATRLNKQIAREISAENPAAPRIVTVIGTRYDESAARAANMAKREDSATEIKEFDGRLLLAPIAHWSIDDVWELLGMAGISAGEYPVWTKDFRGTIDTYREALSGECPVVAMAGKMGKSGCGARFGCVVCACVKTDRSLAAMAEDAKNAHLRRLLANRDFLVKIQGDYTRRSWVTRQVEDGRDGKLRVKIQPDGFNSRTLLDLAGGYMLADREENDRAARFDAAVRAGRMPDDDYLRRRVADGEGLDTGYIERMRHPQFMIVDDRKLIGADFYNAILRRHARPFELLELHRKIWFEGYSPDLPDAPAVPSAPAPAARWITLDAEGHCYPGLGEPLVYTMASECFDPSEMHFKDGQPFVARQSTSFDVDHEAASLIVELLYPTDWRLLHRNPSKRPTDAVEAYLSLGAVSLSPQGRARLHKLMMVRQRVEAAGLYDMDAADLLELAGVEAAPGFAI